MPEVCQHYHDNTKTAQAYYIYMYNYIYILLTFAAAVVDASLPHVQSIKVCTPQKWHSEDQCAPDL